jgi:methionine-gamma-lyase
MARNLDIKAVGPQTLAIHAGEQPDPVTGASSPNIVMSSTFVTEKPEGFSAYELTEDSPFVYTRWANPTVRQLEQKVAIMEGAEAASAFASGMAAASAILFAELSSGDHLILSDVAYAGIAELARDTLPRMGIAVSKVDTSDLEALAAAVRPETGGAAGGRQHLRQPAGVQAAGVGGGLRDAFGDQVYRRPWRRGGRAGLRGRGSDPALGFRGHRSLRRGDEPLQRLADRAQETALAVARWLEGDPRVARVNYPGLQSHPQHELARRQMTNFSGMMSFQLKGSEADGLAAAERMGRDLGIIHYAVSLGHHRSLICWMPTEAMIGNSFRLEGVQAEAYRDWAGPGIFRFSVGLEDAEDLIRDLDGVL